MSDDFQQYLDSLDTGNYPEPMRNAVFHRTKPEDPFAIHRRLQRIARLLAAKRMAKELYGSRAVEPAPVLSAASLQHKKKKKLWRDTQRALAAQLATEFDRLPEKKREGRSKRQFIMEKANEYTRKMGDIEVDIDPESLWRNYYQQTQ